MILSCHHNLGPVLYRIRRFLPKAWDQKYLHLPGSTPPRYHGPEDAVWRIPFSCFTSFRTVAYRKLRMQSYPG